MVRAPSGLDRLLGRLLVQPWQQHPEIREEMLKTMREPPFLVLMVFFWNIFCYTILVYSTHNMIPFFLICLDISTAYVRIFLGNGKIGQHTHWNDHLNMMATTLLMLSVSTEIYLLLNVKAVPTVVMGSILAIGASGYVTSCFSAFPAIAMMMIVFLNSALTIGLLTSPFEELRILGPMMPVAGIGFSLLMLHAHDALIEAIQAKYENRQRSLHDPLTGLPNRLMMSERLAALCLRQPDIDAENGSFALLCLDLDGFKQVNDRYGHAAGDEVLTTVAKILATEVAADSLVCRIGGDEFVILLPTGDRDAVAGLAERLISVVSRPFSLVLGVRAQVGLTIGAALYPEHGTSQDALLSCADDALYEAKRAGKGRWLFAPSLRPPLTTAA